MDTNVNQNYCYTRKSITLYNIECDTVATPWSYEDTINWYRKEIGYEPDEPLDVSLIDIEKEGMWVYYKPDEVTEELLRKVFDEIEGLKELIIGDYNSKFNNIRMYDGDLNKFISYKDYCIEYLSSDKEMKSPEIIANTEY